MRRRCNRSCCARNCRIRPAAATPPSRAGCATSTTAARCYGWSTRRFAPLALREGERILAEAQQRFGVARARCAHRVGPLAIGELAVWVGVSAAHRGEAFDACRYIIDEVKHRVPIWKKEYYQDGDSGWVNCERCAAACTPHASRAAAAPDAPEHGHGHGQGRGHG
jgi:hypothetical protein